MLDKKIQDYLFTLRRRGIKVGLHRTEALLSKCGNPHNNIPVIHIAGTNGKGSTAAMIASILRESGKKVGLYTSPHLIRFNERIRVNGTPISDDHIVDFINRYHNDMDDLGSTFFEAATALTFSYFFLCDIDIAVIEVGLGGRLDSTNVSKSVLSVITPIDYDHMEFLGYDLISIAQEKFGIIKPDTTVVSSNQHPEVVKILRETANNRQSNLYLSDKFVSINNTIFAPDRTTFNVSGKNYHLPLLGKHQIINAQTAITACKIFDKQIKTLFIQKGLENVKWPGRLQKVFVNPLIFYDVAHNPHGLKAVLESIRELYPEYNIASICALKKTKQIEEIVDLIQKYCTKIIVSAPDYSDFFSPRTLLKMLREKNIYSFYTETVTDALSHCSRELIKKKYIWLIFGTHYISKDVFNYFNYSFDNGEI